MNFRFWAHALFFAFNVGHKSDRKNPISGDVGFSHIDTPIISVAYVLCSGESLSS